MRKKVNDYVENCLTCLTCNSSSNRLENELHLDALPNAPMQVVHADHFGPLQPTEEDCKYVLVVVDAYTRFTWLCATRTTSARETIRCLQQIFNTFGNPTELITDRGTAFTATEFNDFASERRIKHRKIAVASPWANGMVERVNRFLKSSLTKLIDMPAGWGKRLGHAQYVINNTYHTSVKSTPSMLMLGYEHRNHEDFALTEITRILASVDKDLEKKRTEIRDAANQATSVIR